jgi:hypothetical protein
MKPVAAVLAVLTSLAAGLAMAGCGEGDRPDNATSIEKCRQLAAAGSTTPACDQLAQRIVRQQEAQFEAKQRRMVPKYCAAIKAADGSLPKAYRQMCSEASLP